MSTSINTKCIQAGYTPKNGEPRQIPIYYSTTFKYDTSEAMGDLFDLKASGYFYSRLQNPTCDIVAEKLTELAEIRKIISSDSPLDTADAPAKVAVSS